MMHAPINTPDVHDAVQCYLDGLLTPDSRDTHGESTTAADGSRPYRICHVSSVQLALPVDCLDQPRPLPPLLNYSSPDWFLGRHHHDGTQLHVFDLARIVAPDVPRSQAAALVPVRARSWAMACTLDESIAWLAHDDIQWREPGGMRPWLSGMTRDGRCAVIDIPALLDLLEADPRYQPEPSS